MVFSTFLKCRNGSSTSIVVTTTKFSRKIILFVVVVIIVPLLLILRQLNQQASLINVVAANINNYNDMILESLVRAGVRGANATTSVDVAVASSSLQQQQHQQHVPFHNWDQTKDWICPITDTNNLEARAPNLTAAVITFRIAQRVAAYNNNNNNDNNVKDEIIKQFFSHWPGYVSIRERSTRRTATFLRTYKCGSITILDYYMRQLRKQKRDFDHFSTHLFWDNNDLARHVKKSSCICTVFRDPMDHFFSGLQEIEYRRDEMRRQNRIKPGEVASYEKEFKLDFLSQERFIGTINFLLNGGWPKVAQSASYWHVFPQSGYLVHLPKLNRTISSYLDLYDDISTSVPRALNETCGLPKDVIPPKITHKEGHEKIPGMKELHKELWNGGSLLMRTKQDRTPLLRSKLEALCLLHAVDYACLSSKLKKSPPDICAEAFQKYL